MMEQLWEEPKFISALLINSNKEDVKNYLADFFVDNFYENILSSNCIENNLLYLITLLLKEEFNKSLNDEKTKEFLNNTNCAYVMEKLSKKKDVQIFFKNVISDVIEKLRQSNSNEEISFDPIKLKKQSLLKDEKNFIKARNKSFDMKINENKKIFQTKYAKSLKEEDLNKYLSENKVKISTNNNYYIYKIINNIKSTPSIYGAKIFSENINTKQLSDLYAENFFKIVEIMDIIFDNLIKNINLLPYSIKCICKIISKLSYVKYHDLDITQTYAFISKFFFYKLLFPILLDPCYSLLITDFNFTANQINNLILIVEILKKFVVGKLFKDDESNESNLTPFNWLFLEKFEKLVIFIEKLIDVDLPEFIESVINDELNEKYKYNYLEENKNEVIFHNSICFSIDDIYILVKNIQENKQILFKENINNELKIILEKILSQENLKKLRVLKKTKKKKDWDVIDDEENEIKQNKKHKENQNHNDNKNKGKIIDYYFLLTFFKFNKQYKDLFEIKRKKIYYNLEETKLDKPTEEQNKDIINKVKNYLISILYNYKDLNKDDFNENSRNNIIDILNEIKKNMKALNILIDGTIPSEWYIKVILEFLPKFPNELINNDYEELFKQIQNDINTSIKNLNFENISSLLEKLKLLEKKINHYENEYNILKDLDLELKIKKMIKEILIPVEIKYKKNKNYFSIKPINNMEDINSNKNTTTKDNDSTEKEKGKEKHNNNDKINIICKTIEDFINNFPDLSREAYNRKLSVLVTLKDIHLPEYINKYFQIVNKVINKEIIKIKDDSELTTRIISKIYDYIMEKIYHKIFPIDIEPEDNMIYLCCNKASWIQPKHLINGKNNYIYSNFIEDVGECFEKIDKGKCPTKKFEYMENIFKCIYNLNAFNGDEVEGIDGEIQILNYALIKAKPKNINSNCEFMRLFLGNRKGKREDIHLTQISVLSSQIAKLNYSNFINITEEEFNEKCKMNISQLLN